MAPNLSTFTTTLDLRLFSLLCSMLHISNLFFNLFFFFFFFFCILYSFAYCFTNLHLAAFCVSLVRSLGGGIHMASNLKTVINFS